MRPHSPQPRPGDSKVAGHPLANLVIEELYLMARQLCVDSRSETPSMVTTWALDYDDPIEMPRAWSQHQWELCHLGSGRFRGRLQTASTASMQLGLYSFAPGVLSRGTLNSDLIFLAAVVSDLPRLNYRGRLLAAHELMALAPNEDIGFHIHQPCKLFTVAVARTRMDEYMDAMGEPTLASHRLFSERSGIDRLALDHCSARSSLCHELDQLLQTACNSPHELRSETHARLFEHQVLDTLWNRVSIANQHREPTRSDKHQAAKRAEAYLRQRLDWPVTVRELCEAVGVGVRCLELGFLETFGISPKAYITTLRLNGIRKDMLQATSGARVSDYAAKWGFFHFSRFAADYRKFFGESPSETLARATCSR
jgi:AraC family ethanolamine operon transcriptional activator